jgi:FAD/FMN-containing dehydrogenase
MSLADGGPKLDGLRQAVGSGRLLSTPAEMAPFLVDWRGKWRGRAIAVAQPATTREVAAIIAWCAEHRVPVVAQGGNTGLSGGSVPDQAGDALLLSLVRLDRIRAVDTENDIIVAEAGCRLAQVQAAAAQAGRLFPLSLAAEGSCTIGGNLSTNAGGVHALRYGTARDLCLGLEVVTAFGEVWDGLRGLRKDNAGYDLRDLFIGAEGTLGIITAAVLKLHPRPANREVAWVAVPSIAAALALLHAMQARAGAALSAFEAINDFSLGLVARHRPDLGARPGRSPFHVLIELTGPGEAAELRGALLAVLEAAFAAGRITDALVAESGAQAAALWAMREAISDAQAAEGPNIKHDICIPLSAAPGFAADVQAGLAHAFPGLRLALFGHLGDGNLHTNVSPPPDGLPRWSRK